jgi:hypothetical protein
MHGDLTKAGFDVWFDRVSIPSRQFTFHQEIRYAIAMRDRLLLVAGLGAVSASDDKTLRVWELETGNCLRVPGGPKGYANSVRGVSVTPDDQTMEICLREVERYHADWHQAQLYRASRRALRLALTPGADRGREFEQILSIPRTVTGT